MANVISSLSVQLGVNTGAFVRDMSKARTAVKSNSARINKFLGKTQREFRKTKKAVNSMASSIFSLKRLAVGAFVGWGVKRLAGSFIETGSSMDKLRLSLDTITKGEGAEWFQKLNEWALKMPINTQKAIQAFTMMRAMGLKPSIADMTTMVDTTSALGGSADILMGISRALGQIKTKGKVSTEELMQLSERGVPAIEILRNKLGLTADQLGNIGRVGLDAQKTIDALISGMEERFGGQSEKIENTWSGMVTSIKSYWMEFKRLVMSSGLMEYLEENLRKIRDWAAKLYESGRLQEWAENVASAIINLGEDIQDFILDTIGDWDTFSAKVSEVFDSLKSRISDIRPVLEAFFKLLKGISWLIDVGSKGAAESSAFMDKISRPKIESNEMGTGPGGLPHTGLFYGHQGEIVLNPAQSEAARSGGDRGGEYHFHLETLAADPATIRTAAQIFKREIGNLQSRWGTE